jgi:hypothetical protein
VRPREHQRRPLRLAVVLRDQLDGITDRVLAVADVRAPRPSAAAAGDNQHAVAGDQRTDVGDVP